MVYFNIASERPVSILILDDKGTINACRSTKSLSVSASGSMIVLELWSMLFVFSSFVPAKK